MALSFNEKRKLHRIIKKRHEELEKGDLSFNEKRIAQKELKSAYEKLTGKTDQGVENEKLRDLIAGKYNSLEPLEFIGLLNEIVSEIKDIEPIKAPTIVYCDENKGRMVKDTVLESVVMSRE